MFTFSELPSIRLFLNYIEARCFSIMEQHSLKNVNTCLNTNIYSYLGTSGGQRSNPYLNVVHFFNASINKTPVAA
jgi:hypothetical protein